MLLSIERRGIGRGETIRRKLFCDGNIALFRYIRLYFDGIAMNKLITLIT